MENSEIQKLLENTEKSLIEVYFDLQRNFEEKYGQNTIVMIEVGSFFEVYGVETDSLKLGKPREIAEILNLQITRRNKNILENSIKNPLLAGFPTAAFDRYIQRLIEENKYTIVVVRQSGIPPKITRFIERIISPGVNFDYTLNHDDNFIASVLVDQNNGLYSVGYSAIDVTTGKTYCQEIHSTRDDGNFALDEVFRLLNVYPTNEVVLTLMHERIDEHVLRQYLEIFNTDIKINKKRLKVDYQNELFKKTYNIQSFLTAIEFLDLEKKPLISEALALLIEFVIDHDFQLIQKLSIPTILSSSYYLYLGNNPLEQLNIISKDPSDFTLAKFLDHTVSSIGRRLFWERLTHPITNKVEIEERYAISDFLAPIVEKIDDELASVYDLERIVRRIVLSRLHPFEVNFLYDSLLAASHVLEFTEQLGDRSIGQNFSDQKNNLKSCIAFLLQVFDFEQTGRVSLQTIERSIFVSGFNTELDDLISKQNLLEGKLYSIRDKILDIVKEQTGKNEVEYVEIKQLDKEGHYLTITRNRFALIEEKLKSTFISVDGQVYAFSDFSYKTQTNNVKITGPIIESLSQQIVIVQSKIVAMTKELYLEVLQKMENEFLCFLQESARFLAEIDVALSNCKTKIKFNLVRPEIVETQGDEIFLEIGDLRHLLVEAREENGIYVPNDVFFGDKKYAKTESLFTQITKENITGILLYGINSSGKSSFMKSIGVAVLLAQCGFYVPARSMRFSLFQELFTRILSRDNFEKGLSSFAVEMMELKNIFNRCSKKSLILGDEISHGTETLSALSIVSATIEHLIEKRSLFLFTTHLHQLCNIPRIQKIKELQSLHLAVHYDEESDKLLFERKLQVGSGSSIYGLEFAQALHLDKEFMKRAQSIRKELAKDYEELELLTKKQRSKYHTDLYLTTCAVCRGVVDETHHISPQEIADQNGNIGHFHKNHKYNLIPLCAACHDRVHAGKLTIRGFVMTSDGLQLDFDEK